MKSTPRLLRPSGVLLVAALFAPSVHAAVRVKNATANELNLASSWTGGLPGFSDIAQWDAPVTGASAWDLGADLNWLGINIANPGGSVTLNAGNTLTLGAGGIDMTAATQNLTISSDLTLLAYRRQIWDVAADRVLTINGSTFTRSAGATLHLQGAGTVAASSLANINGIVGAWASHGTSINTAYATISGGNIVGLTGTAALTAADVTDTTGAVNYDLAGAGDLGTGASFNTLRYTGGTGTVAGDFKANGLMNVATNTLTLSGNVTIGDSRELVVNAANSGNNFVFSGVISDNAAGASGFTKTGAGTVTLAGDNSYSGQTVVNRGTLRITHSNALGSTAGGTVIVAGDRAGNGNPELPGGQLLIEADGLVIDEPITIIGRGSNLTPYALRITGGDVTLRGPITTDTAAGAARIEGTKGRLTIEGGVTGTGNGLLVLNPQNGTTLAFTTTPLDLAAGAFYLDTSGTVELAVGGNTWGNTNVAGGTLKMMAANVIPATSPLILGLGYSRNGTVDLNGFDQTVGPLDGNFADGTRTVTSPTEATLTVNQTSNRTYNGQLTGPITLVKEGGSTLTLAGASTHTGDTRVNAGTLNIGHVDVLKNSTLDTGESGLQNVAFTATGTNTYNLGGLKGADALSIGNNTLSVGGNNQDTGFIGDISATGGGLNKVGTGTLLTEGILTGLSAINVNEGSFGGKALILSPVNVASGAALQAGDGILASGNLAIGESLTLANDSVVKLTLGGGLTHSSLARIGGDWSFDLNQSFTFLGSGITTGVYQDIITNLTGSEAGMASIGTWVITNEGFSGTFAFDGANVDLTLTSVPEPSAVVSLLGGVALLAGFRRRRLNR